MTATRERRVPRLAQLMLDIARRSQKRGDAEAAESAYQLALRHADGPLRAEIAERYAKLLQCQGLHNEASAIRGLAT
jgi:hypothetical protein